MVDSWKLVQFHKILKQDEMLIVKFVGVLAWQLVNLGKTTNAEDDSATAVLHPLVIDGMNSNQSSSNVGSSISCDVPLCMCASRQQQVRTLSDAV